MTPRNPLQLKRKTHFLAREHLRRFADTQGQIHVYRKGSPEPFSTSPDVEGLFNVQGVWSHQAENRMAVVESRFWRTIECFQLTPTNLDQDAISEYFALWRARVEFSRSFKEFEGPLAGVTPRDLKKKVKVRDRAGNEAEVTQEEVLEYRGAGFHSTDIQASARSTSGMIIRWFMDYVRCHITEARVRWGAVEVPDAALVLPDRTTSFDIPISPHWFLHGFGEKEQFAPLSTAPASIAARLNRGHLDDAYAVVVANSPGILRRLVGLKSDKMSTRSS